LPVLRRARATSAGGVVIRAVDDRIEVALVHRRSPRLWALPKGTPDSGETREETGLEVEIEAPITAIRYFFVRGTTRFHKTVHFYLMRATGGSPDDHDAEFDEVRWVPLEEALALLTHATERSILDQAAAIATGGGVGSREARASAEATG